MNQQSSSVLTTQWLALICLQRRRIRRLLEIPRRLPILLRRMLSSYITLPQHPKTLPPPEPYVTVRQKDSFHGLWCVIPGYEEREFRWPVLALLDHYSSIPAIMQSQLVLSDCIRHPPHSLFSKYIPHMAIKPDHFLVDTDRNLLLTDWNECIAPAYTMAPRSR